MDVNKVSLIGRLTAKPEGRDAPAWQRLATFSVATSTNPDVAGKTQLHRVVVWGQLAEIVSKYLDKGSRVYIEGTLVHRQWSDHHGAKRSAEVVADEIILLSSTQ